MFKPVRHALHESVVQVAAVHDQRVGEAGNQMQTCSNGSSGGSKAFLATARVARLGRSMTRESSTACHSMRVRLRDDPTSPVTCTSALGRLL